MKMTRIEKKFVNASRHGEKNLEILRNLLAHFDSGAVKEVLEIGCGVGTVAEHLSSRLGMHVTATDADAEQVELARSHHAEGQALRFQQADATDLPFGADEFDMVLSLNVFHHINDWGRALSEVARVLRPGGGFLFYDLAYSRLLTAVLGRIVRNYGLYTIADIVDGSRRRGMDVVYRAEPVGRVLAEHAMVLRSSPR